MKRLIAKRMQEPLYEQYLLTPKKIFNDYVNEKGSWKDFAYVVSDNWTGDITEITIYPESFIDFVSNKFNVDPDTVSDFIGKNLSTIIKNAEVWVEDYYYTNEV